MPLPRPEELRGLKTADRLAALARTGLLDAPAEEAFDRHTRFVSRVLDVPMSTLTLVDAERLFFKSQVGLPGTWVLRREAPHAESLCHYVVGTAEPVSVRDLRDATLARRENPPRALGGVAYLGVPLVTADRQPVGALCAIAAEPRDWSERDIEILRQVAASVMTEVELRARLAEGRRAMEEARFQTWLLDAAPAAVAGLGMNGAVRYWSRGARELLGWTLEDVAGRPPTELTTDGASGVLGAAIARTRGGEAWRGEVAMRAKSGEVLPIALRLSPVRDRSGEMAGAVLVMDDGRDQRRDEMAAAPTVVAAPEPLDVGAREMRVVVEEAGDGLLIADQSGCVVFANPRAAEMLGYAAGELAGARFQEFDPEEHAGANPLRFAVLRAGKTLVTDRRFVRRDGGSVSVEVSARLLPDGRLHAVVRDIGDRKRAEDKARRADHLLRQAHAAAALGEWHWEILTGVMHWSLGLEALHGMAAGSFVGTFDGYQSAIHDEDRPQVLRTLRHAIEHDVPYRATYRITGGDGQHRWLEERGRVHREPDGRPARMSAVVWERSED